MRLDRSGGSAADVTILQRTHDLDAHRNTWLYQMDLAMLQHSPQKSKDGTGVSDAAKSMDAAQGAAPAQLTPAAARAAPAGAPPASAAMTSSSPGGGSSTLRSMQRAGTAPERPASEVGTVLPAGGAVVLPNPSAADSASAVAGSPIPLDEAGLAPSAASSRQAVAPAQTADSAATTSSEGVGADEPLEPEDAADAGRALAEAEPIAARNLHLQRDGLNVDVWIRDGHLDAAGQGAVVQALAEQLSASGVRLRNASVNGHAVYRGERWAASHEPAARFDVEVSSSEQEG